MSVIVCDDFLSDEDFKLFSEYVLSKNKTQEVFDDPSFATEFWNRYEKQLRSFDLSPKCSGITSNITVTCNSSPIRRHMDRNYYGERYKILIYLNDIPNGGTLFYPPTGTQIVENKANRLVLFDLSIPHESQKFNTRTNQLKKMAIGFRLFAEPVLP
jgi:hypothetical protein